MPGRRSEELWEQPVLVLPCAQSNSAIIGRIFVEFPELFPFPLSAGGPVSHSYAPVEPQRGAFPDNGLHGPAQNLAPLYGGPASSNITPHVGPPEEATRCRSLPPAARAPASRAPARAPWQPHANGEMPACGPRGRACPAPLRPVPLDAVLAAAPRAVGVTHGHCKVFRVTQRVSSATPCDASRRRRRRPFRGTRWRTYCYAFDDGSLPCVPRILHWSFVFFIGFSYF